MAEKYSASASKMSAIDYKGKDHKISEFSVNQTLSEPFEIIATVISNNFDLKNQLGQLMTVKNNINNSSEMVSSQSYNGAIVKIDTIGFEKDLQYTAYRITLKPWFELLKHSQSFRVYQNQTTKDIVTDIFDKAGFKGCYKVATMPNTKREYCLQYNESDYDFVSRLLAEEGVHYYFEHSSSDHTMVLHDAQTPFDKAKRNKFDMAETPSGSLPLIDRWETGLAFHGNSVELTAYDYEQTKLVTSKAQRNNNTIANNTNLTNTFYPTLGISGDKTDLANNLAKRRSEYLAQEYQMVSIEAKHDLFEIGKWFSLASHLESEQLSDYSVVSVSSYYTDNVECYTKAIAIPKSTSHYPEPRGKQTVNGIQSATVAGKKLGDINQDESGRVRIQFHWDSDAEGDKTSCYVRVAQMLAGNGYGTQFIPRVGQEVLVSFIDGDPDQPIITGSVYNSKNAPPYKETNSTKSGIKTKLDGLANELYFDDKKDSELVYLHATKDLKREIENNQNDSVKGELHQSVTKQIAISTEDNYSLTVSKLLSEKAKTIEIEADDKISFKVGSSKLTMSSSGISIEATDINIKASSALKMNGANITSSANASNKLSGATTAIEAKGSSSVKGLSVSIKADTTLSAEGSLSAEFKSGLKATFNGGVMGEVKGAIVKVN